MAAEQFEEFLSDWPKQEIDRGRNIVRITGQYVQPTLLRNAQGVFALVMMALLVLYSWQAVEETETVLISPYTIPFIALAAAFIVWFSLRRNLDIRIGRETIEIGRRKFSRAVPMEFSVVHHHKAIAEAEKNKPTRTWRHAIEVIMRYDERRVTLAEMRQRDSELAKGLAIRLQNVCAGFEKLMGHPAAPDEARTPQRAASDFGPAQDVR